MNTNTDKFFKLSNEIINDCAADFDKTASHTVAMNATIKNGITASCSNYHEQARCQHNFSISLEQGEITNQKKSGRCWMFAGLNVMRLQLLKKLNLKTVELSQSYPLFWDKFEKANFFLENILETVEHAQDSRIIQHLLASPVADGGQWDMFVNIVEKYGIVPKEVMNESFTSSETADLNKYLTLKLREYALTIRKQYAQGKSIEEIREKKTDMLKTIYRMLCISLGKPPTFFEWGVRDKDNKFKKIACTPQDFYKDYIDIKLDSYISLINAPTIDKPYNKTYTVEFLGNVCGARPVLYLNVPSAELKRTAIAQLKDGQGVWFGCDVKQWYLGTEGLLSMHSVSPENLFNTDFSLTKAERLDYGESLMTHAMTFTGVNLNDKKEPDRWQVENSWGKDVGKDGYWVMSDDWFDNFTYQVVVQKKYLTSEQKEQLKQNPIVLKPWDPMGSLA